MSLKNTIRKVSNFFKNAVEKTVAFFKSAKIWIIIGLLAIAIYAIWWFKLPFFGLFSTMKETLRKAKDANKRKDAETTHTEITPEVPDVLPSNFEKKSDKAIDALDALINRLENE